MNIFRWLYWYRAGFINRIDPSWEALPWFTLPQTLRDQLIQVHPDAAINLLELDLTDPHKPDERLLNLISLSPAMLKALFALVGSICDQSTDSLTVGDREWCQRISKGLRPETWLPFDADFRHAHRLLSLLLPLFQSGSWTRFRLQFPQDDVIQAEDFARTHQVVYGHRLRALWDAALWRIQERM